MPKKDNFRCERAWIFKKIRNGVSQDELRTSVGIFSNRKKKKVMAQKNLSEKQYKKRSEFLGNAYALLNNEDFSRKRVNSKKKDYVIPRTERSAFRSREYKKSELEAMVDNIDDINF